MFSSTVSEYGEASQQIFLRGGNFTLTLKIQEYICYSLFSITSSVKQNVDDLKLSPMLFVYSKNISYSSQKIKTVKCRKKTLSSVALLRQSVLVWGLLLIA